VITKMAVFWAMTNRPDDGGSTDLRNAGKLIPVSMALQRRRQPSSKIYHNWSSAASKWRFWANKDWASNSYKLNKLILWDRPYFHQEMKEWKILLLLDDTLNYIGHIPHRTSELTLSLNGASSYSMQKKKKYFNETKIVQYSYNVNMALLRRGILYHCWNHTTFNKTIWKLLWH
jgi:hypothetical protein